MQVENIEGLTRDDIETLVEYIELVTEVLKELPGGMEAIGRGLLNKPDLFFKLGALLGRV